MSIGYFLWVLTRASQCRVQSTWSLVGTAVVEEGCFTSRSWLQSPGQGQLRDCPLSDPASERAAGAAPPRMPVLPLPHRCSSVSGASPVAVALLSGAAVCFCRASPAACWRCACLCAAGWGAGAANEQRCGGTPALGSSRGIGDLLCHRPLSLGTPAATMGLASFSRRDEQRRERGSDSCAETLLQKELFQTLRGLAAQAVWLLHLPPF